LAKIIPKFQLRSKKKTLAKKLHKLLEQFVERTFQIAQKTKKAIKKVRIDLFYGYI